MYVRVIYFFVGEQGREIGALCVLRHTKKLLTMMAFKDYPISSTKKKYILK